MATRLLKLREGEISKGEIPGIFFDKVLFDELVEDYLKDYCINRRKSAQRAGISTGHLTKFFGGMKVTQITTALINRNMIRSGIPERVAMEISGHKTRAVFDRYHIVSAQDLKEASRKYQEYLKRQAVTANSYNLVTVDPQKGDPGDGPKKQPFDIIQN